MTRNIDTLTPVFILRTMLSVGERLSISIQRAIEREMYMLEMNTTLE